MNNSYPLSAEEPWKRTLFTLFFLAINSFILKSLVFVTAVVQWGHIMIKGELNPYLATFSEGLSNYSYRLTRYVTYLSDDKPFPFAAWDSNKL